MTTKIENSKLTAQINHSGAELFSLKDNNNKEYIWEGNPAFWGKHSPILFPIIGTLKNNSFSYKGNEYHLSRHGFARDMEFDLIQKSENSATFSLSSSTETRKVFPFDFELQIKYSLNENKLIIEYKVVNKNEEVLPFSIGAHPAFALTKPFENYSLAFEQTEKLTSYQLENDLISEISETINLNKNKLPLSYSLFEKDALIFKTLKSRSIDILENRAPLLRISFDDFPNLGIWTKNKAPFLCIEPWLGYSDTINCSGNILEKEGIQLLKGNKTFNSTFSIEIF